MISKIRLSLLGFGAWLGMQACVFAHDEECAKNSDCKSGLCDAGTCVAMSEVSPREELPGGEQCTAQSEVERYQELNGPGWGVPIPPECATETLEGPFTGVVAPYDSTHGFPGPNTVGARISGSSLLELGGVPCQPIFPGRARNETFFDSEESKCSQYFACGCCTVEFERHPMVRGDEPVRRDVWSIDPGSPCDIDIKHTQYYFNIDFDEPPAEPPVIVGNACDTCLAGCQGLSGCCTGSGCLCQSACAPSSDCGPGSTYCCGPDGFCFCTPNCPY